MSLYSFLIDVESARKAWLEGIIFPGLISLTIIIVSFIPDLLDKLVYKALAAGTAGVLSLTIQMLILFMYTWLALCMVPAYLAKVFEQTKHFKWLAKPMIIISGFGPLLCAITFASYIAEWKKQELKWDKTEKTGKVAIKKS